MHHLPRQFFGGKVHLFGDTVQFNSSVFLEAEVGLIAFTILNRLVREAKPTACYAEGNFVCADLYYCMMPAVKSVGRGVRAKQRCPGGPKFGVEVSDQSNLSLRVKRQTARGLDDTCDEFLFRK